MPPTVIGSLLVGTYLLLAQQMSQMEEKPDLTAWAGSLHRLIREGCLAPGRLRAARPAAPARALEDFPAPAHAGPRALSYP